MWKQIIYHKNKYVTPQNECIYKNVDGDATKCVNNINIL